MTILFGSSVHFFFCFLTLLLTAHYANRAYKLTVTKQRFFQFTVRYASGVYDVRRPLAPRPPLSRFAPRNHHARSLFRPTYSCPPHTEITEYASRSVPISTSLFYFQRPIKESTPSSVYSQPGEKCQASKTDGRLKEGNSLARTNIPVNDESKLVRIAVMAFRSLDDGQLCEGFGFHETIPYWRFA